MSETISIPRKYVHCGLCLILSSLGNDPVLFTFELSFAVCGCALSEWPYNCKMSPYLIS